MRLLIKWATFLFLPLMAVPAHAGLVSDINAVLAKQDLQALQKYIDAATQKNKRLMIGWLRSRELVAGFSEGVLKIEQSTPDKKDPDVTSIEPYQVKLLFDKKHIIFYKFVKIVNVKQGDNWEPTDSTIARAWDEERYKKLELAFFTTFHAPLCQDELFNVDQIVYGNRCGIVGQDPEPRKIMEQFVGSKNHRSLYEWLQSSMLEKQVYALEGFYLLKLKGYKLTDDEKAMMTAIYAKKGNLYTCSGCSYMTFDDVTMALHRLEIKLPF